MEQSVEMLLITLIQVFFDLLFLFWDTTIFLILSLYYIVEAIVLTILPTCLRPMDDLTNNIVLVTGGGGGVGRQLALQLARLKAIVVVWDINKDAIDKTCELILGEGYKIHGYVVDLADRKSVYKMADVMKNEVGPIDILINNAGVVYGRTLMDLEDYMIENTYKVNILSHYWTTRAFLGDMIDAGKGHIVTVASVAGLLGTYRCTDYSATKFAAVGFHESLYTELKTHGHSNINATLVCPYFINTGMFAGAKPRLLPMLEPHEVASRIISSIRLREVNCMMPPSVRYLLPLKCLLPAKMCWALMYRVIRGPQSMMTFRGHNKLEYSQ